MMYCKPGAYQKDKLAYFFDMRPVCTIFAPRKSQLLLEDG